MSDDPLRQSQQENKMQLPVCQCCPPVKEPGGGYKPFLQVADQVLLDDAGGGNPLNVSETKMFPPEIWYDARQLGFEAEYRVFYGLHGSQIPMYVFHGLKSVKTNEEMADFIIVTNKLVVALEVKEFALVEDPKDENINCFRKIIEKSIEQQDRLHGNVKSFLEAHDCKVSNDHELPLATFSLFPWAERDHHSPYIEEKDKDRVLFGDEYITKLQEIIELEIVDELKRQYQLRILLAWFYGTFSYEEMADFIFGGRLKRFIQPDKERIKNRPETQETRKLCLEIEKLCSVYEKADSFLQKHSS